MITPELQKYVSDSRAAGMSNEQIGLSLGNQGWAIEDINQVLGLNTVKYIPATPTSAPSLDSKQIHHVSKWVWILVPISLLLIIVAIITAVLLRKTALSDLMELNEQATSSSNDSSTNTNNINPANQDLINSLSQSCQTALSYFSYDKVLQLIGEPVNIGSLGMGECHFITKSSAASYQPAMFSIQMVDYKNSATSKSAFDAFLNQKKQNRTGTQPCDEYAEGIEPKNPGALGYKGSIIFIAHAENMSSVTSAKAAEIIMNACTQIK